MKKILNLAKWVCLVLFTGVNFFAITGCRDSDTIVYGNYENYMSVDLMHELSHNDNVSFDYYGDDNNLEANFKNNIFDVGTVSASTLVKMQRKGLLKRINWQDFGLKTTNQNNELVPVRNATDAQNLFTKPVQSILQNYDNDVDDHNLLEWGIPYFIQSFVFVYWGDQPFNFGRDNTWKNILTTIKDHYSRFNNNQLTCVEDPMTLFTLSKLIHGDRVTKIQPSDSIKEILKNYNEIFSSFTNILNKHNFHSSSNVMLLNSDSYYSVNKIAEREANGAFMFNGDALFASMGGEYMGDHPPIPGKNFFVAIPTTPVALDMIVVNKNITSSEKLNRINKVIHKVALDVNFNPHEKTISGSTWQNFESVMYTSPLSVIQNYIESKEWDWVDQNEAWKSLDYQTKQGIDRELDKIYNIPEHNLAYEPLLSDEQKATLALAFAQFKENL